MFNPSYSDIMLYISDLQRLTKSWQERIDTTSYPSSYKDGVMECIYELNQLIDRSILNQFTGEEARQYMIEHEADYLSREENHYAAAI